jgi:ABC-type sugar transport system permease subunit
VVVEGILGRLKTEVRYQSGQLNERLKNRTILLWTLALCPIVILPPVLALFLSFCSPKRADGQATNSYAPDVLILIVAVCNIIVSVLFWRWIGDAAVSMGLSIGLFLKSIGISHPSGLRPI